MENKILSFLELKNIPKSDYIFVCFCLIFIVVLFFLPTGFEKAYMNKGIPVKTLVIEVDNSTVQPMGMIRTGEQGLKLKILDGKFKNQIVKSSNLFMGKLEFDKVYKAGDKVFAVMEVEGEKIIYVNPVDHYRLNYELILIIIFIMILIFYAGWTGFKALISFIFTGILIWKLMLPLFLKGYNPIICSMILVIVIVCVIIFLVAGFTKKGLIAFLGSILGIGITGVLSLIFGSVFKIHGAVQPFAESLLYSGFQNVNISDIFLSGIFISSAGAVMDVAMDVSASISEIVAKKPDISKKEIIFSGFTIGRAVIGTMTTTLLLAYSGGYATLFMVFIAQGTPTLNILNIQYVSAEILHTLVGSLGPIIVAPITAVIGGMIAKSKIHSVL
jgi:uncharacterized membrane protein